MTTENQPDINYMLKPGYIYVPQQSVYISTVIGSAVAVCIFDRKKRIGGMGHFQLPHISEKGKTTALYGNVATVTLINMMLNRESVEKHLEAQIFGGAFNPDKSDWDIGRENIEEARKRLRKKRITVISEDVGGEKGRKVVFSTASNEVAVLKVDNLRDADWYPYNQ